MNNNILLFIFIASKSNAIKLLEQNETYAFDISKDGMELATCGRDRNIRIYRFANAEYCEETRLGSFIPRFFPTAVDEDMREMGHGMTIHAIKFHPDNSCQIISAGWDNIVKVLCIKPITSLFCMCRCGIQELKSTLSGK